MLHILSGKLTANYTF